MFNIEWKFEIDGKGTKESQKETGILPAYLKLIIIEVQPQEEDESLEDVIFLLVTYGLAEEVQHPQIEVVLLDFSIADLEIVEEGYDEGNQRFLVVEV
jgi:hypothetical protein